MRLGHPQSASVPGRVLSQAQKEPRSWGTQVLRRRALSDARDKTSQASRAAAGGSPTLATKHASRGHLLLLPLRPPGAPPGTQTVRCGGAGCSPLFLGEAGGLGNLGGAVAVGGGAGARTKPEARSPKSVSPGKNGFSVHPIEFSF